MLYSGMQSTSLCVPRMGNSSSLFPEKDYFVIEKSRIYVSKNSNNIDSTTAGK